MSIYALVNSQGTIVNICEWDGGDSWTPPAYLTAVLSDGTAAIGGTYANGAFVAPQPPPPPIVVPPPPSPLKVLTDLLVSKNLVSQADITAAETEAGVTLNQVASS